MTKKSTKVVFKKMTMKQLVETADPGRKKRRVPEYKFPGITFYGKRGG